MADAVAEEQLLSREMTSTNNGISVETLWFVFNTKDPLVALNLLPKAGEVYNLEGVLIETYVSEVVLSPTENVAPLTQTATVSYKPLDGGGGGGGAVGTASWSLSIGTETIHIQEGINQQNFPPTLLPDLAINKTNEGVDGIDILSSNAVLKINHWLNEADATPVFLDKIQTEVGARTNKSAFKGPWGNWKSGEALYMGAEVSSGGEPGILQLSHTFQRSVEGIVKTPWAFAGTVLPDKSLKKGWEYLWTRFKDLVDTDLKGATKQPISSHIAEVYKEADFNILQLPKEFFPED